MFNIQRGKCIIALIVLLSVNEIVPLIEMFKNEQGLQLMIALGVVGSVGQVEAGFIHTHDSLRPT